MLFSYKFRCPPPRPESKWPQDLGGRRAIALGYWQTSFNLLKHYSNEGGQNITTRSPDFSDLPTSLIIINCCCHFALRFSPFRSTYNTHVGKSSVSYSIQHCCSGESAKEISFLSFNGFGEHMEWASISFRSIWTIPKLRQQRDWVDGVRKLAIFSDVQYNIS